MRAAPGPEMARSVCGGSPPPSRALRVSLGNGLRPPVTAEPLHPLRPETRARPEPARTGRGPSPAGCGHSIPHRRRYQPRPHFTRRCVQLTSVTAGRREGPTLADGGIAPGAQRFGGCPASRPRYPGDLATALRPDTGQDAYHHGHSWTRHIGAHLRRARPGGHVHDLCKQGSGARVPLRSMALSARGAYACYYSNLSLGLRRRRRKGQPTHGPVGAEGDADIPRPMGHRDGYSFDVDLTDPGKRRRTVVSI